VNLRALPADAGKIRVRVVAQDFVDLAIVERCVETSDEAVGPSAGAAAAGSRKREYR
jgi:hypothetical protein